MIERKRYKQWDIYFAKNNYNCEILGQTLIEDNYTVLDVLKDTERNYVAVINISGKNYILKEFRSEMIIPQRKFKTLFKDGEAVTTLKNGIGAITNGLEELVIPLVAIVKRNLFINKSFLLMEYIEGKKLKHIEDIYEVLNLTKKIHNLNRYHGDLNTSNFIKTTSGLKILDTQMKIEKITYLNRERDLLVLKEDLLVLELGVDVEGLYPEMSRKLSYRVSKFFRKLKKLKAVEWIRKKKKILRKKGWKI